MGRSRRTLLAAFALSLLIHLLAGPFVRRTDVPEPTASFAPFVIQTARPKPPPPTPKPTPTPKPAPQHTKPPEARSNPVRVPRQSHHNVSAPTAAAPRSAPGRVGDGLGTGGHGNVGDVVASPAPAAIAPVMPASPPTLAPTATPSCAHPNAAPATIEAASVDTPPLAQQNGISGVVDVIVRLDEHSRVVAARIERTPSALLNYAALRAARASTFRTEVRDCLPVAAEYIFSVEFVAQ